MRFRILLSAYFAATLTLGFSQQTVQEYAGQITPEDLKANLSILASDALEGRETGKRGQKMAAAFIASHYAELGLTPPVNGSYYQPVELYTGVPGDTYVKIGSKIFRNYEEVVYYGTANSSGEVTVPVVFAGKGRPEDIDGLDLKDKAAVVLLGESESYRSKIDGLRAKGIKMAFFFNDSPEAFKQLSAQYKNYYKGGILSVEKPEANSTNAGIFYLSPNVIESLFNISASKLKDAAEGGTGKSSFKKIKSTSITYKTSTDVKTLKTENILGFLEGTDKKDEIIIITSHYDHIGMLSSGEGDRINNGADDDGSGTVAVMQLAKVFTQAKKDGNGPRRSILFMNVTGEEKGLLGSDYYTRSPVFPLANTMVNLNIDMVGRRDPQHKDSAAYVYVIGSDKLSLELHNLNEAMNEKYTKLKFDYTYNDQNHPDRLYYRSDHWNFAKNNIPIIFYFDGIHEDYHKPSDEIDKIEFDLLTKRAQLVFYTAWELANRDKKVLPDIKGK